MAAIGVESIFSLDRGRTVRKLRNYSNGYNEFMNRDSFDEMIWQESLLYKYKSLLGITCPFKAKILKRKYSLLSFHLQHDIHTQVAYSRVQRQL